MNAIDDHGAVAHSLRALLQSGHLPASAQTTGAELLGELNSPTRVLIAGPQSAVRTALVNALCAQSRLEVVLLVADTLGAFDPATADICLWCTAEFSPAEARLWQTVPDDVKAQSFLVAQTDPVTGSQSRFWSHLENIAAQEFHCLFPIVLDSALGSDNAALLREVAAVVAWRQVSATDNARTFVEIYRGKATYPLAHRLDAEGSVTITDQAAIKDAAAQGLSVLAAYATDLSPERVGDAAEALDRILTVCSAAAEELSDTLQNHLKAGQTPLKIALLCDDARAAADNILLLSMEGGLEPAITAVTTLVQMRRELDLHHV